MPHPDWQEFHTLPQRTEGAERVTEPKMWEITTRDESGRIWSTYYEGGDRESVLGSFALSMPLTIGSISPVSISEVVSS
jgi:hypothetical protein